VVKHIKIKKYNMPDGEGKPTEKPKPDEGGDPT
jgi:hypothetical protein